MYRAVLIAAAMLAGCTQELSPEEQAIKDERDVAMVELANMAAEPLQLVTPEPILDPDIESHDLLGATCNYAPGTSLGTRVLARKEDAYIKVKGEMLRFAADPGSRELPLGTRSAYNGRTHVLHLALAQGGETDSEKSADGSGASSPDYEGSITLRDRHGRVVYEGSGMAQCRI